MDRLTSIPTPPVTTTRPATSHDDPLLFELYKTTRAEEMAFVAWGEAEKNQFLHQQFLAQKNHYLHTFPNATHDLILLNQRGIGRLYVNRTPSEIHLIDIALFPHACNQGIGSYYFDKLKQEAQRTHRPLRFHVWQQNHAAQRFYHRHGCTVVKDTGASLLMEWRA